MAQEPASGIGPVTFTGAAVGEYDAMIVRSAPKKGAISKALIGAAMLAGVRIGPETRVYATLRPGITEGLPLLNPA